jgi:hypothetical protein
MNACTQALVPPSGGGSGSMTDAFERAVIVFASPTTDFFVRDAWDVCVGILVISSSSCRDGVLDGTLIDAYDAS